jgi:hypothetical protein
MDTDPYSSPLAYFRAELKRLRERSGMTQGEVAERTNYALRLSRRTKRGDWYRLLTLPSGQTKYSGQTITTRRPKPITAISRGYKD